MPDFYKAVGRTLEFEGGYINDPDDPGGETNFGISKRAHPEVDIKNLTRLAAQNIYKSEYWNPIKAYNFLDRYQLLVESVFDFAVNAGVRRASKYLQAATNDLRAQRIEVDGYIGWVTIGAVHQIDAVKMANYYNLLRLKYYRKLSRNRIRRKFLYSWIVRLTDA